ncbi:MAG: right-handed parallel beta-helix repeat-containing protein, partial [Opitutaceae bacterium]
GSSPGGNRFAQAIHVSNSKDTYIENVTIYAAGGMGLIAERSENIHLNHFVVTTKEGRTLSTRADATHFLGCKGEIRLENCLLENMADDGINVHGAYVRIESYKGERTFLCEISHVQQHGLIFAEAGDEVLVISRETLLPLFEAKVSKVEILDEQQLLVTVDGVLEHMPKGMLSMENLTWNPDLVMKNNTIRNNRARSALITTKGSVLVEGNYFSSQMHGILIEGDNNKWYESGGVQDVIIRKNTFENIGYGDGEGYPLYIAPLFTSDQRIGAEQYHRNIRVVGNHLKSFNGLLVHALSVEGLVVTGNTIEFDDLYPIVSGLPAIDLHFCEDFQVESNTFTGFEWPILTEVSKDSSNANI